MYFASLITKELLKRGYSVENGAKIWNIADSRLFYLSTEQAQAYLNMEKSEEYIKVVNRQVQEQLLLENARLILNKIDDEAINIVDFRCCQGKEAAVLARLLNNKKLRYCPLDISKHFVKKAIETFSQLNIKDFIESPCNFSDIENFECLTPRLNGGEFKRNLFLLLRNVLGNFEINEIMYEVRSAMREGDLLLISIAVADNKIRERTRLLGKNEYVNNLLKYIPLQLGLEEKDIEYGTRFKNSRIEFYYKIISDKKINFEGKTINLNRGDQIIVAFSYKHTADELRRYFMEYFDNVDFILSDDKSQAIVLCKK